MLYCVHFLKGSIWYSIAFAGCVVCIGDVREIVCLRLRERVCVVCESVCMCVHVYGVRVCVRDDGFCTVYLD